MTTRPGPTRVSVLRCDGCPHFKLESHGEGDDWYAIASCMHGTRAPRHIGADTATPEWCPLPAPPDPRDALLTEVAGTWTAFEHALREAIGNTNYNVIAERIEAAIGDKEESNDNG